MALFDVNNFVPSIQDVTSLITRKSRVMLLNSPSKPKGSKLPYGDAASLAEVAVERDMNVISDEVCQKIVYGDNKHVCMATLPEMRARTLVVGSFSKTYAMTGLRVGCVYGPTELIDPLWLVHQYTVTCVDSIAQHIALADLTGPQDFVESMVNEFKRRRDFIHKGWMRLG